MKRGKWQAACAVLAALLLLPAGCGDANPQPVPQVTTVLNTSAPCAACDRKIAKVTKENTFTYKGVLYVVCNEKCADEIRDWIDTLDE